ncbi:MAG: hypothetical protein HFG32_13825 [Eubacterium sp.]|nr:hypothetical protein [Clostridia bacterium]MCI9421049.1 hypothetical protein [Eubacterium sp.]
MLLIIITTIVLYSILIAWTWFGLGYVEKSKKVIFILIGILAIYFITLMVYQMTKGSVTYENTQMQQSVQNVLVAIFTGVNGMIVLPQVGKMLDKVQEEEIEKNIVKKRMLILAMILILCLVFEVGYMKDTQVGILKMYDMKK